MAEARITQPTELPREVPSLPHRLPGHWWLAWPALALVALVLPAAMGQYWSFVIAQAAVAAIIVLSLSLLIGFAGQISLAQSAFVGAGAYASARLEASFHIPLWEALPLAVGVGFILGLVVGVPALRLAGMYLAISTFGLAMVADRFVFQLPELGGLNGLSLTRPRTPIDLTSNTNFAYLVLALLGLVLFCLWQLRDSRTGWYLAAIRDDERAAEMAGVDVAIYKLLAFGFSGALAALGGALLGYLALHLNPLDFSAFTSISYLALAVVTGPRNLFGALIAGALYVVLPQVSTNINPHSAAVLPVVLPAFLIVAIYAVTTERPKQMASQLWRWSRGR
jgi:branched-chain amino acid transport system permease protein